MPFREAIALYYEGHPSRSHVTTHGQSVSMSWCPALSGTCDQILLSVGMLLSESCGHIYIYIYIYIYVGKVPLSAERAPHKDRTTNSRPKLLKRKRYLVKRPQSGLDTKTYWLTDWPTAVKWLWLILRIQDSSVSIVTVLQKKDKRITYLFSVWLQASKLGSRADQKPSTERIMRASSSG
jgi:hypothetical protein